MKRSCFLFICVYVRIDMAYWGELKGGGCFMCVLFLYIGRDI